MRSFLIALSIFLAVILLISVDSVIVLRKTDELLSLCEATESDSPAALDELVAAWQDCRSYLSLTVHQIEIERADSALLLAACSRSDPQTVQMQLRLFAEAVRHIADSRRPDLSNIL